MHTYTHTYIYTYIYIYIYIYIYTYIHTYKHTIHTIHNIHKSKDTGSVSALSYTQRHYRLLYASQRDVPDRDYQMSIRTEPIKF